ncbi:putative odorant receptor 83c [Phlebotomus argentipes]|uniref:putative odorant receptor 83c n=1 Tax=Phlebotomus argentipes TaxID=94469 RepID=UPI0028932A9E|nr:putative odorant receptor 83c [Phlebotomus argentipes]
MEIMEYFDSLLASQDHLISDIRAKYYLKNSKLIYMIGRTYIVSFSICAVIITMFQAYYSANNLPLFYSIPGIPRESIFFYPVNLIYQLPTFWIVYEMYLTSDIILVSLIIYFDAEMMSIADLIATMNTPNLSESELGLILKKTLETHVVLTKFAEDLKALLWHCYLIKLFMVTFLLISGMFLIQIDVNWFIPAVLIILVGIINCFIMCFLGQFLLDGSELMSESLYMMKWHEMKTSDQKALLMLMISFDRHLKVETFGFGTINYNTFVQICKASFSYATIFYALLK